MHPKLEADPTQRALKLYNLPSLLQELFAKAESMYSIIDKEHRFIFFNEIAKLAAFHFANRYPEVGDDLFDFINPQLATQLKLDLATTIAKSPVKRTVTLHSEEKDGTSFLFSYKLSVLEPYNYIMMEAVNFTAFNQMQKEIIDKHHYLNTIFDTIGTGIKITDSNGVILNCNEAYQQIVGRTEAELIGASSMITVYPEDVDPARAQLEEFLVSGRHPQRNWSIRHKSGKPIDVDITIKKTQINGELHLIYGLSDISLQNELKNELLQSNLSKSALIDNLPVLLWSVDENLRLVTANTTAKEYFKSNLNYTFKEGDVVTNVFSAKDAHRATERYARYQEIMKSGESQKFHSLEYNQGELQHLTGEMHPIIQKNRVRGITCYMEIDTDAFLRKKLSEGFSIFTKHCAHAKSVNEVLRFLVEDILSRLYIDEGEILTLKDGVFTPNVVYRMNSVMQVPNLEEKYGFKLKLGEGIIGISAQQKQTIVVADCAQDERVISIISKFSSEIAVPIYLYSEVFAIINCESKHKDFFKPIFAEVLEAAAKEAGEQIRKLQDLHKIKEIQSLHTAILNSTPNSFILIDENFRILSLNGKAVKMLSQYKNRSVSEGYCFLDCVPEVEKANFENQVETSYQGALHKFEREITHPNGSVYWIQLTLAPAYNANEEIFGVTIIIENITQAKKTEQLILNQNFELRKTNKELDHFIYSISHDVRAPLSSIEGLSGLIDLASTMEEMREYNVYIQESTQKLDNFIRNILAFNRNKRKENQLESILPKEVIKEVIQANRYLPGFKNIEFKINAMNTPVLADLFRFKIILDSVLSNAIKFHDGNKENRWISIDISTLDNMLIITIVDNGMGIPEAYLPKVFNMFYTAYKETRGNGIGLYILKETVAFLKGKVEIESTEHEGTSIKISLPQ